VEWNRESGVLVLDWDGRGGEGLEIVKRWWNGSENGDLDSDRRGGEGLEIVKRR